MAEKTYLAIDLKSFYASVECMEQGWDPLTTNLVVADLSRTEKTICLALSTLHVDVIHPYANGDGSCGERLWRGGLLCRN